MQNQGMHSDYIPIPYELIGKINMSMTSTIILIYTSDLTASFIASLMHGVTSDLILMTSSLSQSSSYRENVNFIRKTLSKAQVSCSSLICSLWYIDQHFQQPRSDWHPRDLFIASVVAADKYL